MDNDRAALLDLLAGIEPVDALEAEHLGRAGDWVRSGAALYRIEPPDVPPMHLVSYIVPFDPGAGRVLLGAHRKSGLLLPPGGHVEPGASPWETVRRETAEELRIEAQRWPPMYTRPLFLTITETRSPRRHKDVSLWHVILGTSEEVVDFDRREFESLRWIALADLPAIPADETDPYLARFARKLSVLVDSLTA